MVTVSAKRVGVALGLLGGLGTAGWLVLALRPPAVDPVLAGKVLPVIDEELERGPWPGMLGGRWFCAERVIEIRHTGDELAVGVEAWCDEYVRDGDELVVGSGEHGPKVVVLTAESDGYRVVRVDVPPDGAGYSPWVERHFSAAGARELNGRTPPQDTAAQAREVLGLRPDAPVRQAR